VLFCDMLGPPPADKVYYDNKTKLLPVVNNGSVDIEVLGNDHVVTDVICFGGQTGLLIDGGANLVEGAHTWNDATSKGGRGIVAVNAHSTRLDMVYLDYTALVLEDPIHVRAVVASGTISQQTASGGMCWADTDGLACRAKGLGGGKCVGRMKMRARFRLRRVEVRGEGTERWAISLGAEFED